MNHTETVQEFNYQEAFSRNIGLLTRDEQERLRDFTIAIPGMGGVGGSHLISFVRQGFEKFKIADLDSFELKNLNRQYGARIDTLGRRKIEVMKEEALKINPNCTIEMFETGISPENIDTFLKGVDFAVDGIDAFEVDVRRMFITESQKRNIPVISAAPIGFGTAFLIFTKQSPLFDTYFAIRDEMPYKDKLISFFVGLIPSMLQRPYMKATNIEERRGPSSIGAINLCGGISSIYAVKVLLKKGRVRAVPYYHQFDVMREKYVVRKMYFGNRNPIQRLKILLAPYLTKD